MKRHKCFKRAAAMLIIGILTVSMLPAAASAAAFGSNPSSGIAVVSDKETTLAPGVTQNLVTALDSNGNRVNMFITTSDMSVDTVKIYANYLDNQNAVLGMSKTTEQVAAAEAKHDEPYTVVAAINASYYNMTTGKPTGTFVMEGNDITDEAEGNKYSYFAVMKDGSVKIGAVGEYSSDKGSIAEAVGGYHHIVKDGKNTQNKADTKKYPRQTIGITADNRVITMTADGNQAPKSVGLTMWEQAQVMIDLGCVEAIHLDGGGSTTYCSKPEGSDTLKVVNSPSDGSERSVSNSLMIVSVAPTSTTFDHVVYDAESEYMTPGTSVKVDITGVSATGNAAEIPAALTYEVSNGTFDNGVFTAGDAAGDAVITAKYNGTDVGKITLNVVRPDALAFNNATLTVPYGKTVNMGLTAKYGVNDVTIKASDLTCVLADPAVGSISGFDFTACEENDSVTGCKVTVTLVANSEVKAEADISLGKGSEVIQGFETGELPDGYVFGTGYPQYGPKGSAKDEHGNYYYNGQNELGELSVVTAKNGKVHDGKYSMAVECDFSQAYETGYHMLNLSGLDITVPAKAQSIGMWIYLPELEELYASSMRFMGKSASGIDVGSPWLWDNCEPYAWENDGWRWVSMDLSGYSETVTIDDLQVYICDRDNTTIDPVFYFKDHASVNGKFTYYMDSITLDYSSAVDDREPPVFSDVLYADTSMPDAVSLNGQTVSNSTVSFTAVVAENIEKTNYTGLDEDELKAYIDGVSVKATYANGRLFVDNAELADGVHTIRFEASDNMGNMSYVERQITVDANSDIPTISIVPQNPDADKILIGSLYWVDLVADCAEDVDEVEVTFNLNSMSQWELDHMVVTPGFEAEYDYDEVNNNATITVTQVGDVPADATVLVQIPIRTWESRLTEYEGYESQTPAKLWSRKIIWPIDIKLSADYGAVTFTDGTEGSFSMVPISVITELYGNYGELNGKGDYANKTSWHIHTEENVADLKPTCTATGYTGRTYCDVCDSIVDWGEDVAPVGHDYEMTDGVLKCECGKLFNGVWEDDKMYEDGVVVDGWKGKKYYVEGTPLVGAYMIDSELCWFDEDGVYDEDESASYMGIVRAGLDLYYVMAGQKVSGWQMDEDDECYYFDPVTFKAVDGKQTIGNKNYEFENHILIDGHWSVSENGIFLYWGENRVKNGWKTIKGNTYYFWYGYATVGPRRIESSTGAGDGRWYLFDENGVFVEKMDGLYDGIYYKEGEKIPYLGLIKLGDDYYYVNDNAKVVAGRSYYISKLNDLTYPNGEAIVKGTYEFAADGKMIIKNGLVDGVYYVNNVVTPYAGLIEVDGDYYYINTHGKPVADRSYYISRLNDVIYPNGEAIVKGTYEFAADGKMIVKNGLVDGVYYVNNVVTPYAGLIEVDGDYYYINTHGKPVAGRSYYITRLNDVTYPDGSAVAKGTYEFDADGKMIIKNGLVDGVYYVNNVVTPYAGLIEVDGDYYYINTHGKPVAGRSYYISRLNNMTYPDGSAVAKGTYEFDADGKMIIKNGLVDGVYYVNNVVTPYAGLIEVNGDYYYINTHGKPVVGRSYYISKTNGLEYNGVAIQKGTYEFAADGKMNLSGLE